MLIEIDGFFQQVIVYGKKCSEAELRKMYHDTLKQVKDIKELAEVFCNLYNLEIIPYSEEVRVDFVIDTDINRIYSPIY